MRKSQIILSVVALAVVAGVIVGWTMTRDVRIAVSEGALGGELQKGKRPPTATKAEYTSSILLTNATAVVDETAAAEDRLVDAFDATTDSWSDEEQARIPGIEDIRAFIAQFKVVPRARQRECLERAINLIPDKNVMLLVGVLMDKEVDPEFVQLVYGDILNREDSVKTEVLQEIAKDKTHICWDDTAWILEVTGELPKNNDSTQ